MFVKDLHLGVTGSRFTLPYEQLIAASTGADLMAHTLALKQGVKCVVHPPILTRYRAFTEKYHAIRQPKDYLARNRDIVNASSILAAMPRSASEEAGGTWYTVRYARKRGKTIYIIHPDGTIHTEEP